MKILIVLDQLRRLLFFHFYGRVRYHKGLVFVCVVFYGSFFDLRILVTPLVSSKLFLTKTTIENKSITNQFFTMI